jgi:hypothetical protein
MNTLWTFGDSYTFGAGCRPDGPVYLLNKTSTEYYDSYKTISDDIFPNLLGKMLNVEVNNLGWSGVSNDYIIDCIIDNWDNFKEEDYVTVQITFYGRFDIPYDKKLESPHFCENYLNNFPLYKKEEIETIINFQYHFAGNKLYKQRQLKRFNFLNKLLKEKKIKTYFWDITEIVQSKEFEKIFDATNGKIGDYHFSFKGHRNFANTMYKKIINPTLI